MLLHKDQSSTGEIIVVYLEENGLPCLPTWMAKTVTVGISIVTALDRAVSSANTKHLDTRARRVLEQPTSQRTFLTLACPPPISSCSVVSYKTQRCVRCFVVIVASETHVSGPGRHYYEFTTRPTQPSCSHLTLTLTHTQPLSTLWSRLRIVTPQTSIPSKTQCPPSRVSRSS